MGGIQKGNMTGIYCKLFVGIYGEDTDAFLLEYGDIIGILEYNGMNILRTTREYRGTIIGTSWEYVINSHQQDRHG